MTLDNLVVRLPTNSKLKTVEDALSSAGRSALDAQYAPGTIYIKDSDDNGQEYWLALRGFYEYSYLEEKSYAENPTRTETGNIVDLNLMPTFFTPRLTIKYKYMHIEEYRALRKIMRKRNEFTIKCYDPVEDKLVTNTMYEAPPPMPTSHIRKLQYMGVIDYTIEFISTKSTRM